MLIQLSVLARLVSPEDYGLIAIVGVVLGIANLFSDMGVNQAYIHKSEVDESLRSGLFWFTCSLCFACCSNNCGGPSDSKVL